MPSKKLQHYLTDITAKHLAVPSNLRLLPVWRTLWKQCAEEPLATHTHPVHYVDGCLILHADSSVWVSKVLHQRPRLIRRLRAHAPAPLTDLHVRVARTPYRSAVDRLPQLRLSQAARDCINTFADGITDPELRAALRRLGRKFG